MCSTVLMCCCLVSAAEAQVSGTNDTNRASMKLLESLDQGDSGAHSLAWKTRFSYELGKSSALLYDRLGPVSALEIMRIFEQNRAQGLEIIDSRAKSAFERVTQNGAQETALAILPIEAWIGRIMPEENLQSFGRRLLTGAFGHTAEEETSDLPITYSASEQVWRIERETEGNYAWGIRPRRAPYIFGTANLGHWNERPAASIIGRVRYLPLDRIQISANATVPLPNSFEVTVGALSEPLHLGETTTASVRIERVGRRSVVFMGLEHNDRENLFVCGLNLVW
jgi:hypothetical protein